MGLWSTNVFVGSVLGTLIPAVWATPTGPWGWSFIVPAFVLLVVSMVILLFLVPDPRVVGMESPLGAVQCPVVGSSNRGISLRKAKIGASGCVKALMIPVRG